MAALDVIITMMMVMVVSDMVVVVINVNVPQHAALSQSAYLLTYLLT